MGERERSRSGELRSRVDDTCSTDQRNTSPVSTIVPAVFSLLFLTGCYVQSDQDASASRARPTARQPKSVFEVAFYAKQIRVKDPDGAIRMIKDGIAKFGETPDLYQGLSLAVDEKMVKAGKGSAAYRQLAKEKLGYLEKAMGLINAGKKWEQDPLGNKTGNLQISIEQARKAAGE